MLLFYTLGNPLITSHAAALKQSVESDGTSDATVRGSKCKWDTISHNDAYNER